MEYLYVCLFSNGHIKVGRSIAPEGRIASHVDRVACMGVELANFRTFACVPDALRAEADLIGCCAGYPSAQRFQNEWFSGIEFGTACQWAERFAATEYEARSSVAPLAESLRLARQAKGLTQSELGEAIGGVSKATVSHWEVGRHEPTLAQLRGICRTLCVSADDLLHTDTTA